MVKMVKKKRSTLQILILITAIAYSFWVILYLIGFFFYSDFLTKMNTGFYVSIGFIAAGLILISLIFALIEKLQRDPFILFSVFILGGRIIGFTAAYLFPGFSRNSLGIYYSSGGYTDAWKGCNILKSKDFNKSIKASDT